MKWLEFERVRWNRNAGEQDRDQHEQRQFMEWESRQERAREASLGGQVEDEVEFVRRRVQACEQ